MHSLSTHQSQSTPGRHGEHAGRESEGRERESEGRARWPCIGEREAARDSGPDSVSTVSACGSLSLSAPVCLSTQHQSGANGAQGCKENINRCLCVCAREREMVRVVTRAQNKVLSF